MNDDSLGEIEFHPTSFCDGNGRLFWSGGELYRGIPEKCAEFTRRIFAAGIVDELNSQQLIPRTRLTKASLPDYPIVLQHERVPFVSYAHEWSPTMLRDAALFAIRVLRKLAPHELTLTDAAPWNILFVGCEPRFIDFSSIVAAREDQGRIPQDLQSYYLRSLELYAQGHGHLARLLLTDYEHGPIAESFAAISGRAGAPGLVGKILQRGRQLAAPDPLTQLEGRLSEFQFAKAESVAGDGAEFEHVEKILSEQQPRSVFVAGVRDDAVALLAARLGAHVLAIDRKAERVDALYQKARAMKANILPLVMDLRYPAAGHGVENNVLAPALTRLRCDMVVALGLIPALVFAQRLRFEQIAGTFSRLAAQTLLVDFPAADEPSIAESLRDPYFHWFNREHFLEALRPHFASIKIDGSLVVCERKCR